MENERLNRQLSFLLEIDRMKQVLRQTLLSDGSRQENDAEHSWHLAMCAAVLAEYAPEADMARVLAMALGHDLVEIYAGDTYAYDDAGNATKEAREREAADRLYALLPAEQGAYWRGLWEEFDAMETPEARLANVCDRLQPVILNLASGGRAWLQHDARISRVRERVRIIGEVSPALGAWVEAQLARAVENGWLRNE